MTRIAFIGLGNMGGPMAANLVRAGHAVFGYDPSEVTRAAAAGAGVRIVGGLAEAASQADVVVTMLPNGEVVLDCYRRDGGLLSAARPGTILIDCSTIDVGSARAAAEAATARGLTALDAPVSGGVGGAAAGTLTFMVGGPGPAFETVKPLLEGMGRKIVRCGGAGAGQAAKICNNMILGVSMIAVSEAFALGEKLGLSAQALFDVASSSSGQCWALTTYCPAPGPVPTSPANHGYEPGFAASLMLKDLRLAQQSAQLAGADTRLASAATGLFEAFVANGGGERDFSAILEAIRSSGASSAAVAAE